MLLGLRFNKRTYFDNSFLSFSYFIMNILTILRATLNTLLLIEGWQVTLVEPAFPNVEIIV